MFCIVGTTKIIARGIEEGRSERPTGRRRNQKERKEIILENLTES